MAFGTGGEGSPGVAGPPPEPHVYEASDVQPLVVAARPVLSVLENVYVDADGYCSVPTRYLRALEKAVKPFDSKEDKTQRGDASERRDQETDALTRIAEPGAVDDGSRLQELLEYCENEAAKVFGGLPMQRARAFALNDVIDRIHQLQANEEKGGEG
jgi:hypothetical protein